MCVSVIREPPLTIDGLKNGGKSAKNTLRDDDAYWRLLIRGELGYKSCILKEFQLRQSLCGHRLTLERLLSFALHHYFQHEWERLLVEEGELALDEDGSKSGFGRWSEAASMASASSRMSVASSIRTGFLPHSRLKFAAAGQLAKRGAIATSPSECGAVSEPTSPLKRANSRYIAGNTPTLKSSPLAAHATSSPKSPKSHLAEWPNRLGLDGAASMEDPSIRAELLRTIKKTRISELADLFIKAKDHKHLPYELLAAEKQLYPSRFTFDIVRLKATASSTEDRQEASPELAKGTWSVFAREVLGERIEQKTKEVDHTTAFLSRHGRVSSAILAELASQQQALLARDPSSAAKSSTNRLEYTSAVAEFWCGEEGFMNELAWIIDVYAERMRGALGREDWNMLFGGIDRLLEVQKCFVAELRAAVDPEAGTIADCDLLAKTFIAFADARTGRFLAPYQSVLQDSSRRDTRLRHLLKHDERVRLMDGELMRQHPRRLEGRQVLAAVFQHAPRYILLIERICSLMPNSTCPAVDASAALAADAPSGQASTESSDASRANVWTIAAATAKTLVTYLDMAVGRFEMSERLFAAYASVRGCPPTFLNQARLLLSELSAFDNSPCLHRNRIGEVARTKVKLYLCNDVVMMAREIGSTGKNDADASQSTYQFVLMAPIEQISFAHDLDVRSGLNGGQFLVEIDGSYTKCWKKTDPAAAEDENADERLSARSSLINSPRKSHLKGTAAVQDEIDESPMRQSLFPLFTKDASRLAAFTSAFKEIKEQHLRSASLASEIFVNKNSDGTGMFEEARFHVYDGAEAYESVDDERRSALLILYADQVPIPATLPISDATESLVILQARDGGMIRFSTRTKTLRFACADSFVPEREFRPVSSVVPELFQALCNAERLRMLYPPFPWHSQVAVHQRFSLARIVERQLAENSSLIRTAASRTTKNLFKKVAQSAVVKGLAGRFGKLRLGDTSDNHTASCGKTEWQPESAIAQHYMETMSIIGGDEDEFFESLDDELSQSMNGTCQSDGAPLADFSFAVPFGTA